MSRIDCPLKRCVSINSETLPEDHDPAAEIEYVDIGNVDQTRGIVSAEKVNFGDAPSRARRLVRDGDTIISTVRTYLKAVAPIEDPPENMVVSTGFAVLRPGAGVHPKFLAWLAQSEGFVQRVEARSVGVSYPAISPSVLGSLSVHLPPIDEQGKIADFLDRETALIDELIGKKKRFVELLDLEQETLVDRLIRLGCDSGLTCQASGENYWKSIPLGWVLTRLMHLTPGYRRIMYGIVLPGPNVTEGVFIVKGGNCEDGKLRAEFLSRTTFEIESAYVRSRLREGDIVYSIRGTIGSAQLVPPELEGANLTQDAARISPRPGVDRKWLLHAVRSRTFFGQLEAGSLGAAVRGINIRDLRRARVPVPPYRDQIRIAAEIDRFTEVNGTLRESVRTGVEKLREYRTALTSAAVTGHLDVRTYRKEPEAVLEAT